MDEVDPTLGHKQLPQSKMDYTEVLNRAYFPRVEINHFNKIPVQLVDRDQFVPGPRQTSVICREMPMNVERITKDYSAESALAEKQLLIKVSCVGICGSDVHYLTHGRIADFVVKAPMVIGHEASGVVAKVGAKVTNFKPGDRVAIEPGVPCRYCNFCKEGRYNLCPDIRFCATPPHDGNLSKYYTHAADFCYKLPDHVSLEEGAMLEPLSVGVHTCRRADVRFGSVVLVLGAGPIGLCAVLAAKTMGATKILSIDVLEHRLKYAERCGANYTLKIDKDQSVDDVCEKIVKLLGERPKKTLDCTGFNNTAQIGLKVTENGGTYVLVGSGSNEMTLALTASANREVNILGVFRYCNEYPLSLEMVASGKVNVKQLITHNFTIEETLKAFDTACKGTGNPVKIMIHCD